MDHLLSVIKDKGGGLGLWHRLGVEGKKKMQKMTTEGGWDSIDLCFKDEKWRNHVHAGIFEID